MRPQLPLVVYLRGAGCGQTTWTEIDAAVADAGWYSEHDFTNAWHLARGGARIVEVDFSATTGFGLYNDTVLVRRVRAKYADPEPGRTTRVPMFVPIASEGEHDRPERFDPTRRNKAGQLGAVVLDVPAVIELIRQAPAGRARAADDPHAHR